jgi:hypothetical protein
LDRSYARSIIIAMRQHRTLARILIALLLLVALAGYTIWWRGVAQRIETQATAWVEARRAEGWTVTTGMLAVGGFPFGWTLDAGPTLLQRPEGLRLELAALSARAAPWSPHRVRVEGDRPTLALPAGAARPSGTLAAARAEALLDLASDGHVVHGDAVLDAPAWTDSTAPVAAQRAQLAWDENGNRARLTLTALHLPIASALGDTVQSVTLALAAEPRLPAGFDAASARAWRDDGGVLQLNDVSLAWGPLSLTGEGTLALDAQNRVELAGTTRMTGWSETIDAMVASGAARPNGGALAKAGLGLIAKPRADGKSEVAIAVGIQDGQLYLGGIRLGAAPRLSIF